MCICKACSRRYCLLRLALTVFQQVLTDREVEPIRGLSKLWPHTHSSTSQGSDHGAAVYPGPGSLQDASDPPAFFFPAMTDGSERKNSAHSNKGAWSEQLRGREGLVSLSISLTQGKLLPTQKAFQSVQGCGNRCFSFFVFCFFKCGFCKQPYEHGSGCWTLHHALTKYSHFPGLQLENNHSSNVDLGDSTSNKPTPFTRAWIWGKGRGKAVCWCKIETTQN